MFDTTNSIGTIEVTLKSPKNNSTLSKQNKNQRLLSSKTGRKLRKKSIGKSQ
jgi:subtilisin-like proprotein convertase family protein